MPSSNLRPPTRANSGIPSHRTPHLMPCQCLVIKSSHSPSKMLPNWARQTSISISPFLSLLLLLLPIPLRMSPQNGQKFQLNPSKLDQLFRRTAFLALLKAKARTTLEEVPQVERVLFGQCLAEQASRTRTPVHYAKCLVKLFWARDRLTVREGKKQGVEAADASSPSVNSAKMRRIRHFFNLWRKRPKREVPEVPNEPRRASESELPESLRNLERLQRFGRALVEFRRFVARTGARNARLIARMIPNAKMHMDGEGPAELVGMQRQVERALSPEGLAVLSPRLFSIQPAKKGTSRLLSPDLLSFHNSSSAALSLPSLLSLVGQRERLVWTDLLMNITGTGRTLAKMAAEFGPKLEVLEQQVLPTIRRIEAMERQWSRLKTSLDPEQRRQLNTRGYAHLRAWQRRLVVDGDREEDEEMEEDWMMGERSLEAKIAELATLDVEGGLAQSCWTSKSRFRQAKQRRRRKRQEIGGIAPNTEGGGRPIPRILSLEPFAFDTRLGGVILEGLFLSPHAFYRELISPEILTIHVLSPVAFYATILSPMAVFGRILSPEAFKLQVLTPQFLNTYTLSPEAFLMEVLSPLAAEARVLAPRALFVQVLGPTFGAVHVGSPDLYGVLVLSPHILSPRIYSEERYLVEVLSPHILGGEHSPEEEDEHRHLGGAIRFVGWPGHSPLGESEESKKGGGGEDEEEGHEHGHGGHVHGKGEAAHAGEAKGEGAAAHAGETEAEHAAHAGETGAEHGEGAEDAGEAGAVHAGEVAAEESLSKAASSFGNDLGAIGGQAQGGVESALGGLGAALSSAGIGRVEMYRAK